MLRRFVSYLLAVVATTVLAAAGSTQFVLAELAALGVQVPLGDRVATTAHDIVGMFPAYGAINAVGFLIALSLAAWLTRRWPAARNALFVLAGAGAVLTALYAMRWSFGITLVAGARSTGGLAVQALAGAAGGWLYARLTRVGEDPP